MTNTNPNPAQCKHWTQVKDIKLKTMRVLFWIIESSIDDNVHAGDIAEHFGIGRPEAGSRLLALYKWNYLSILTPYNPTTHLPKRYYVNDFGFAKYQELIKRKKTPPRGKKERR